MREKVERSPHTMMELFKDGAGALAAGVASNPEGDAARAMRSLVGTKAVSTSGFLVMMVLAFLTRQSE